jgi:autotransporter-associated beta strand protein
MSGAWRRFEFLARLASPAALFVAMWLGGSVAHAQNATWVGGNGADPNEWVEPANWTPNTIPSGTATFTNTGVTTVANDAGIVVIGAINFTGTPNAQAYTINVYNPFIINGAGVTNNSSNTQTFNVTTSGATGNSGTLVFQESSSANLGSGAVTYNVDPSLFIFFENSSTAGAHTTFSNNGIIEFQDNSSAGSAAITNNLGGQIDFFSSATAANANITNASGATITFNNNATAATSTIGNAGTLIFNNSSNGGTTAVITNNTSGATVTFNDTSSAGGATINTTNSGVTVTFNNSSSGDTATFTSNPGTGVNYTFNNTSTAGSANFQLVDATLTFNNTSTAGSAIITMPNAMHPGNVVFNDSSSAGTANFTVVSSTGLPAQGLLTFLSTSTAANATITNNPGLGTGGGTTEFGTLGGTDTSNAGSANITNNSHGTTDFFANTSASSATITNNSGGNTNFQDQSTAANAIIINNSGGNTNFGVPIVGTDTSTAGNANITNNGGGTTNFNALTTAGSATITTNSSSFLNFNDASTAASANITNNAFGTTQFLNTSSAGSATITNVVNGVTSFFDTSTAGNAIINNNGGATTFENSSTAASATITTNSGGYVAFEATSSGGQANITTNAGGVLDISLLTTGGTTLGSIAGAGNVFLGANTLTVGSLNLSTTVGGVISDDGFGGGTGGSLVKVGTGTLTLSGANTYTGATTIDAGTLMVNGSIASSSGVTVNSGGTLAGTGTVSSTVIASGGTLSPGNAPGHAPGTITVAGPLTLNSGSTLSYQLGTANVVGGSTNDLTIVNGNLTINGGTLNVTNSGSFGAGVYQIIDYTGTLGGSGTLTVGTLPNGDTGVIQTTISGEVNLVVSNGTALTQFWDGATTTGDGTIHGGNGTWNNSSTNWTAANGAINASWQGGIAVFAGTAGTVTVSQAVSYQGLQFLTTGYVVTAAAGGALMPTGVATINVGSGLTATISAPIEGSGGLQTTGTGTLILSGTNTYSGGTMISAGTLQATNNSSVGTGTVTLDGGTFQSGGAGLIFTNAVAINTSGGTIDTQANTLTLSGAIGNGNGTTGALTKIGSGTLVLSGTSSYTGATNVSAGTLQAGAANAFAPSSAFTVASGATLNLNSFNETIGSLAGAGSVTLGSAALTLSNAAGTFSGVIGGSGGSLIQTAGTETLTGANTYTGGTKLNGGTLVVGNNSALGTGTLAMAAGTTLSFLNNGNFAIANAITMTGDPFFTPPAGTTQTLSGVIANGGSAGTLEMSGAGTLVLSATDAYTGPTNINSGTLDVTGSIASSSLTTIAKGAALTGTGTVGSLQVNAGGAFAPGNGTPGTSMTIAGNLAFASGALYLVQVNPANATSANVSGSATLTGATVNAQFAPGSYVKHQYTILTAAGGLGGTTFGGLTNIKLPTGTSDSLSYDPDHVYLNLTAGFTQYTGLTINQQNVANTLTNFFNTTGGIPAAFFGLTPGGLTMIDGEVATGAERAAFQLMDEFLQLMLDPFVDGRLGSGIGSGGGKALGFAPDQQASLPPDIALAYAGVLKAPPPAPFAQRWTAWGAAYGGSNTTNGDPVVVGSSNVTTGTFGFAGGMDYHYSPDTIFGFALAGGGTNWGLAGGLGTGRSDAFQSGVYGITRSGPAYLAAALAFANHWMITNRSALGDQLTANFEAQSYGARVEAGYRYAVLPALGVTPYAALQAQAFQTPSYSETDVTGGGFGLSYNAMSATDVRSELGARFDDPAVIGGLPLLLRARVGWAHDWVSNPALSAVFETLPGTNFVVNGAPMPQNSALTSAGAELFITPHLTLLAKFDGEFAPGSLTYAGSGTLRYSW